MGAERKQIKLQYDKQLENQQQQQQWQAGQNQIDRDWQNQFYNMQLAGQSALWQEQFDKTNEYNSPSAQVARLQAAGINPSVLTGALGAGNASPISAPSAPSGGSSHSVSMTGLPTVNGVSSDAALFSSLAQMNDALSHVAQTGLNADRQRALLSKEGENLMADTDKKRQETSLTNIQALLQQRWGDSEAQARVNSLVASAEELRARGDYHGAASALAKANEALANSRKMQTDKLTPRLVSELDARIKYLNNEADLARERVSTERSQQAVNQARASLDDALARTEDDLRQGRVSVLELGNEARGLENSMLRMQKYEFTETQGARIQALIDGYHREGLINDELYKRIEALGIKNNYANARELLGICGDALGIASGVQNIKHLEIRDLNDRQRLDIQREFNRLYEQRLNSESFEETDFFNPDGSSAGSRQTYRSNRSR